MNILFERELEQLKKKILFLGSMVEESVQKAIESLGENDRTLASDVIQHDEDIDKMEIEIEEECLKILALHQPVAADLRYIISILKINNDLERIGDLATNIAGRTLYLCDLSEFQIHNHIFSMSKLVQRMVKESLDSLVNKNAELAHRVIDNDQEVDELHKSMYEIIHSQVETNKGQTRQWFQLLAVSRYLERMADHATNIAEDVIYLVNGAIVRHPGISG